MFVFIKEGRKKIRTILDPKVNKSYSRISIIILKLLVAQCVVFIVMSSMLTVGVLVS